MTAGDIKQLLAERHAKDLFVLECKDGPSWGNGLCILDAWAMKRSWAHPLSVGYEIKVSRNDFLRDDKWHSYLDYCNEFYFVCPPELISASELPVEVGLLWASKNGRMLYCKKKAHRRDVEIPEAFYRYVLMCRTKIVPSTLHYTDNTGGQLEYWRKFVADREEKQSLGHVASKKIREQINNQIEKAESDNKALQRNIKELQDIKEFCVSIGFDFKGWHSGYRIKSKIQEIVNGLPEQFKEHLSSTISNLERIREELQ